MRNVKIALFLFLALISTVSHSQVELTNRDEIIKTLKLEELLKNGNNLRLQGLTIAILGTGFKGIEEVIPSANYELISDYDKAFLDSHKLDELLPQDQLDPQDGHATIMAQIIWEVMGEPKGLKFIFLNANDIRAYEAAIHYVVDRNQQSRIHFIHDASPFQGVSNGDGKGPVGELVRLATAKGIIYIAAAGNDHGRVHEGPAELDRTGCFLFKNADGEKRDTLRFRSRADKLRVKIVASVNAFGPRFKTGTKLDINTFLFNENYPTVENLPWEEQIKPSNLAAPDAMGIKKQVEGGKELVQGEDYLPREEFTTVLSRTSQNGFYHVKVCRGGGSFNRETDKIKVMVVNDGLVLDDSIDFVDANGQSELGAQAESPNSVSIGSWENYSSQGANGRPDIIMPIAKAEFSNREGGSGTSEASAIFQAAAGLVWGLDKKMTMQTLKKKFEWVNQEGKRLAAQARQNQKSPNAPNGVQNGAQGNQPNIPAPVPAGGLRPGSVLPQGAPQGLPQPGIPGPAQGFPAPGVPGQGAPGIGQPLNPNVGPNGIPNGLPVAPIPGQNPGLPGPGGVAPVPVPIGGAAPRVVVPNGGVAGAPKPLPGGHPNYLPQPRPFPGPVGPGGLAPIAPQPFPVNPVPNFRPLLPQGPGVLPPPPPPPSAVRPGQLPPPPPSAVPGNRPAYGFPPPGGLRPGIAPYGVPAPVPYIR